MGQSDTSYRLNDLKRLGRKKEEGGQSEALG